MDIISAALDAAYAVFITLSDLLEPALGGLSAAAAIVLVTLALRAVLIPVAISQGRADIHRRRLAPKLAELRTRYANSPERLAKATQDLYASEKVSPFAGILPALAQAPVLSIVYGVFIHPEIAGHANALLAQTVGGVSLGAGFWTTVGGGGIVVFVALVGVLVGVGLLNRRQSLALVAERPVGVLAALTWMPLFTAVIALFVPLAAVVYLTVSSLWGLAERTIIRRILTARSAS